MKPHVALAFALHCRLKKSAPATPGPAVVNTSDVQLYAYTVRMRSGMIREMKTLGRGLTEAKMFAQREVEAYGGVIVKPVSLNKVYEWRRTT